MHKCPAPDCQVQVSRNLFACPPHWYSIPKPLRDELNRAYREEPLTDRHVAAMDACEAFLRGDVG